MCALCFFVQSFLAYILTSQFTFSCCYISVTYFGKVTPIVHPHHLFSTVFTLITCVLRFVSLFYLSSYHPSYSCLDIINFIYLGQIIQQVFTLITHTLRHYLLCLSTHALHSLPPLLTQGMYMPQAGLSLLWQTEGWLRPLPHPLACAGLGSWQLLLPAGIGVASSRWSGYFRTAWLLAGRLQASCSASLFSFCS